MKAKTIIGCRPRWNVAILGWLLISCAHASVAETEATVDLRVLIDVSGSMKTNDPNKLRASAVRILAGLLPRHTRAGIWTFGQFVNRNIKPAPVNDNWKQAVRAEFKDIHSHGLFTNIEDAMKQASADWQETDPMSRRHMILLTDGMVDVAEDDNLDLASKDRLLGEILPAITAAGATIHAIALSENADHELLQQLAAANKGIYAAVKDAGELERIFLHLFENTTQQESLPLYKNRFSVDEHIQDITLLFFRKADSANTRLIAPDGTAYDSRTQAPDLSWHQEVSADLITVNNPLAGEWRVEADEDDDNRVFIATNLHLRVSALPNQITGGDEVPVHASLTQNGDLLSETELVRRTNFTLAYGMNKEPLKSRPMLDNGRNTDSIENDGLHSAVITDLTDDGEVSITVKVLAPTFQRQYTHHLQINAPEPQSNANAEQAMARPEPISQGETMSATPVPAKAMAKAGNQEAASMSFILVTVIVLVLNIVLIVGGYFGYKYWKTRSRNAIAAEAGELKYE